MAIVRPLAQVGAADIDAVGGKAANLGELIRANFTVPDGFVLTTEAYAAAAQAAGVDRQQRAPPNNSEVRGTRCRCQSSPRGVRGAR